MLRGASASSNGRDYERDHVSESEFDCLVVFLNLPQA